MRSPGQKGHIIVTTAILLAALLGFIALTADFGFLYTSRTGAQAVSDAAALAAASTFVFQPMATQPDTAEQAAIATATAQKILGKPVLSSEVDVDVNVASQLVKVRVFRTEPTFFAKALGIGSAAVDVTAFAEASDVPTGAGCVKPWFLPSSIGADDTSCQSISNNTRRRECEQTLICSQCGKDPNDASSDGMQLLLAPDGLGGYSLTAHGATVLGRTVAIRPLSPSEALAPSSFYSLRFAGNSGGSDYQASIETCTSNAAAFCAECYSVETGNMVGPTTDGTWNLIDLNDDAVPDDNLYPPSATGDSLGRYCYGPSLSDCTFSGSNQLIVVPVWDVCATPGAGGCPAENFCEDKDEDGIPDAKYSGSTVSLKIAGFVTLFVHTLVDDDVQATILDISGCKANSGGRGTSPPGPLALPIQLVRPAGDTPTDEEG